MKLFTILLLSASIFVCICSLAFAQLNEELTFVYYPVKPEQGVSLYKQLFKDSPIEHKGRKTVGITDWEIKYEWTRAELANGLCEVKDIKAVRLCTITLPKLVSDDQKLNSDFNSYIPLLKEHELTHCRIAANYARQLETEVRSLQIMKCEDLNKSVKQVYRRAILDAKAAHRRFDQDTVEARKTKGRPAKILLGNSYLTTE